MTEPRIIKKYPNRRLYDTAISSYITLEDVRRLVIEQIEIKVIDARSQNDITHSTLLQIIIEQEESGPSLFSIDSLQSMIRSYGGTMQEMLSKMFEQGMEIFTKQQVLFNGGIAESTHEPQNKDPLRLMTDIAQKNMAHWQQLQHQWMNNFVDESPVPESSGDKAPDAFHASDATKEAD